MKATNKELNEVKTHFISFIEFCHTKGLDTDYQYLTDSFIFDNITLLSNAAIGEADFKNIASRPDIAGKDPQLKANIENSLQYFSRRLQELKNKRTEKHVINPLPVPTVKSMFTGLEYSGNNDSSYKDVPSALALATFKV